MNSISNVVLSISAVVLLWLNWNLRSASAEQQTTGRDKVVAPEPVGSSGDPTLNTNLSLKATLFDWATIETTDYKQYIRCLRAAGFPAELVREVVLADINKMYEPRERALRQALVPYDAPISKRQRPDISLDDWQRTKPLWELCIEKQQAAESVLDEYVPREVLRTMVSRPYEAYEYAFGQLPPEKREPVQWVQEVEFYTEEYNYFTIPDHAAELKSFKQTCEERDEALLKVLTPEEFERYEMNTTPAGVELARRVIGMQPTDEEFQKMNRIANKNWIDTGGVYGRWRANDVPAEQIAAADWEMDQSVQEVLGPDRYVDYRMAISATGQQMRNFATRFDLPRETMVQAFQLQAQLDAMAGVAPAVGGGVAVSGGNPAQLQQELQQLLGSDLWQAWKPGRNIRASLDP